MREQTDLQYHLKLVHLEWTEMCVILHSATVNESFSLSQAIGAVSHAGLGKDVVLLKIPECIKKNPSVYRNLREEGYVRQVACLLVDSH